ncbi:PREDICTED: neuron navigator 2-like, partial [Tinamus guttatus]|uniref:neuron navigator 2-like n=1 Tax=Tinamus guttatus TaxID=94827 RepID=UPI00052E72BE
NEKIEDINGCPKNRSQMIENIDACLSFLAAKGINIQGLSAEEIRNGNLKAILGLFFSLSRYKQQQQQPPRAGPPAPAALPAQGPAPQQHPCKAQPEMQSSENSCALGAHVNAPPREEAVVLRVLSLLRAGRSPYAGVPTASARVRLAPSTLPCARAPPGCCPARWYSCEIPRPDTKTKSVTLELPGPTVRVSAAGSEAKTRGSLSANNRRSQSFNNYDKSKPGISPSTSTSSNEKDSADGAAPQPAGMNENVCSSVQSCSSALGCTNSSAIPQPSSAIKPWRSKSLSAKHTATSSMLSVKQPGSEPPKPSLEMVKTAPNGQKSMLEKLKLFNSKGGSKAGGTALECPGSQENGCEKLEVLPSFEESEEIDAPTQNVNNPGPMSSSPKIALKGIAQRTFSRALTNKKSSPKGNEKDKEKQKEKEKEKSKDTAKRTSITEKLDIKEEPKEEQTALATTEMPKKSSKIASFIPKGGKLNSAKKEASAPSHSGIPKPGMKNTTGKSSSAPVSAKESERSRSAKPGSGLPHQKTQLDSRNSSSSSSLASSEGKGGLHSSSSSHAVNGTATQTTGSNTVSVQLPHPQQQYSHPNTATVAPFMYRYGCLLGAWGSHRDRQR